MYQALTIENMVRGDTGMARDLIKATLRDMELGTTWIKPRYQMLGGGELRVTRVDGGFEIAGQSRA